jgi:FlaA1/EpsC-like NDP-sugar epimerase
MTDCLDLERFIERAVTGRVGSLFQPDIDARKRDINDRVAGRSILVIGGAGTIGSEFIRSLLPYGPSRVVVIDTNENGLTELVRDLRSSYETRIPEDLRTYPIDFGGRIFERFVRREGPFEVVACFAARKHVRSEKDVYSIEEMIETNVTKTRRLLDMLDSRPPERLFSVSTDKAANPANVLGASKKLMEMVLLAHADRFHVTTARFANVAFSNGSLLDGFLARLRRRQPLSSPSDVRRWFVSPRESGDLCLLAATLGNPGDVFFPKLGRESLKTFAEIALALVRELGLEPKIFDNEHDARKSAAMMPDSPTSWPVYLFQSDTSGEKPEEEFVTATEQPDLQSFRSVGVIHRGVVPTARDVDRFLGRLNKAFDQDVVEKAKVLALLGEILPDFQHVEKGKSLDQRM